MGAARWVGHTEPFTSGLGSLSVVTEPFASPLGNPSVVTEPSTSGLGSPSVMTEPSTSPLGNPSVVPQHPTPRTYARRTSGPMKSPCARKSSTMGAWASHEMASRISSKLKPPRPPDSNSWRMRGAGS